MKAQTRRGAVVESLANLAVGFGISYLINYLCLPLFHMQPSTGALFGLGGIFTIASVIRSYFLRRIFEALRIRKAPPAFLYIVEQLAAERLRQINSEGYDLAHDDQYQKGELQRAAAWYALGSTRHYGPGTALDVSQRALFGNSELGWPWDRVYWKPTTERRDLVKAGALIVAAIARHDRANGGAQ